MDMAFQQNEEGDAPASTEVEDFSVFETVWTSMKPKNLKMPIHPSLSKSKEERTPNAGVSSDNNQNQGMCLFK